VDDDVSSLIDLLASIGRLSNTYVVFASDNGYEFGEHSLVGKGDLFEESVRVPLMVRGPGIVPGTTNRLTSNIDLADFLMVGDTAAGVDDGSWAANAGINGEPPVECCPGISNDIDANRPVAATVSQWA
jgi:arylsulfatase A-like enzyme